MEDTTQNDSETDEFSLMLAQLAAPTTQAVIPIRPTVSDASEHETRAPELMGADELAAAPPPFPPLPVSAPPLVSPPELLPRASAPSATPPAAPPRVSEPSTPSALLAPVPTSPAPRDPGAPPLDFAAILAAPPDIAPSAQPAAALIDRGSSQLAAPNLDRSTVGEKLVFVLAFLLPPLGLLAALAGSIASARRRGWVVGLLRAALVVSTVLTTVVGIAGYLGYVALRQQQQHDAIAASSAAFCATIKADPSMIRLPSFGWPAVAASIPESLAAMQAYEGRWVELAAVSPLGIRPEVTTIAAQAKKITDGVAVARTIDDAANISAMSSVASASGVPAWYAQYCN